MSQAGSKAFSIAPGTYIQQINGDTGSATGAIITFTALNSGDNSGSTVNFAASGSTVVFNVTDISSNKFNTLIGLNAGNSSITGSNNTALGLGTLHALTTATNCTAIGNSALARATIQSYSTAVGSSALANSSGLGGEDNTAVGYQALTNLTSGLGNTAIGMGSSLPSGAGSALTGNENYNICINHPGQTGVSNGIYIGNSNNSSSSGGKCFIQGIYGNALSNPSTNALLVVDGTTAQIASLPLATNGQIPIGSTGGAPVLNTITAGTGISVTNGANSITISATGTTTLNYTSVTTSPYIVTATDDFLGVTTSSIAITIQLPNAPATGRVFVIKDAIGNAATNNITVTTVGGVVTIDGSTSVVMNTAFESISVLFNGTSYLIF